MKNNIRKSFELYIEAIEYFIENDMPFHDIPEKYGFMDHHETCNISEEYEGSCHHCPLNAKEINKTVNGDGYCCDEFFKWSYSENKKDAKAFLKLMKSVVENSGPNNNEIVKAIEILKYHNEWRRGTQEESKHTPTVIGKAIDTIIKFVEEEIN